MMGFCTGRNRKLDKGDQTEDWPIDFIQCGKPASLGDAEDAGASSPMLRGPSVLGECVRAVRRGIAACIGVEGINSRIDVSNGGHVLDYARKNNQLFSGSQHKKRIGVGVNQTVRFEGEFGSATQM